MSLRLYQPWALFLLALVFTVGLTFASIELPYILDDALQQIIATPGGDSHATAADQYRTELFIGHYHLRLIGYVCFALTIALIVAGFAARKSGLAAFGAIAFMLPVFAQFAGVMFFLAGLGILNVIWLPVLDISFDVQRLGLIIRAPYDLLMWLFRHVGVSAYWPLVTLCIGGGILLFLLGTFAWLTARSRKTDVADFWVYRFSRHPQYLGWIIWTYGLYLLLMQSRYPKRSWGIDASLPWLVSTMVIIGVAMIEELNMKRRFGDSYEAYRGTTPFLFPLPAFLTKIFSWPFTVLFGRDRPERPREVAIVLVLETVLLIGASALFYGPGSDSALALIRSDESQRQQIEAVISELRSNSSARQRYFIAGRLVEFGRPVLPYLITLLQDQDAGVRVNAAERLRELPSPDAVPALVAALNDPVDDVRHAVIGTLGVIGAPESKDLLLSLAAESDKVSRRLAARALAEMGDDRAIGSLLEQVCDPVLWMSIGAAEDLGTLRADEGIPILTEQLSHESPLMRRAAAVALARIGSPDAGPALRAALEDDDWEVRFYAREALRIIGAADIDAENASFPSPEERRQ